MALPSLFWERLEQMEDTRNQRLSLLQTERELQITKSQLLSAKLSSIRSLEQSCFKSEQKIASRKFAISSLKAQLDSLHSKYHHILQQIRVLKNEVEELEELEKHKEISYGLESLETKKFEAQVENFVLDCQVQVHESRNKINELKEIFVEVKANSEYINCSEIAAAEMRKSELSAAKENLDRSLASNYQIRTQLQKQLHILLSGKNKESFPSCINK